MKIYLAIPYTWNASRSFVIANEVAAKLMQMGHVVFSPISHSHNIADYMDESLRYSQEFWMHKDLPFVEWADELWVVCIGEMGSELIAESKGCQEEMSQARALGKEIRVVDYYTGLIKLPSLTR